MKVAFDISPLSTAHNTRGIGLYTKNLLSYLYKTKQVEIVEFTNESTLKDIDAIHHPYFDLFKHSLPKVFNFPTIVTIHDVTPLIFPKHYPPGIKGQVSLFLQKLSLKKVSLVQTDSESSKADINRYLGVGLDKIRVTYLAAGEEYRKVSNKDVLAKIAKRYFLPKKFAVFIGNVNWNKNIVGLTEACINADLDLVLIGSSFLQKDNLEHSELRSLVEFQKRFTDNPRVHILGFVPTDDLVAIINQAEVLLYPSYYEGFGIPILEAQACGVPVITSNISSMPEVAGDSALLVDPYNVDEISTAIKKIISGELLKKQLIKKGYENANRFCWEKTADGTVKIYYELLEKSS